MKRKRLPSSCRKFIRQEKAQIRRKFSDTKKQEELIQNLYSNFTPLNPESSGFQVGDKSSVKVK